MRLVLLLAFVFLVFVLPRLLRGAKLRSANRLATAGLRGRALVLSSSRNATGVTINGQRFQRRQMKLEIELPGAQPYELTGGFLIPRGLVDAIPGSSLDVAVDPKDRTSIVVLGPGGVSGPWLRAGLGPPPPY